MGTINEIFFLPVHFLSATGTLAVFRLKRKWRQLKLWLPPRQTRHELILSARKIQRKRRGIVNRRRNMESHGRESSIGAALDDATMWTEHSHFSSTIYGPAVTADPVTAIEFDVATDLLWLGHYSGRMTSLSICDPDAEAIYAAAASEEDPADLLYQIQTPSIVRYSSFESNQQSEMVNQILSLPQSSIISVAGSSISVHSLGGMRIGGFSCASCRDCIDSNVAKAFDTAGHSSMTFTCADHIRDPTVPRTSPSYMPSHIVAGSSYGTAHVFDLSSGLDEAVISYSDVGASNIQNHNSYGGSDNTSTVLKILSNGHIMVAGGADGRLRILDGKFRSRDVIGFIDAHSGTLRDMCLLDDDGRTLLTCGTTRRALNPYDTNSPFKHVPDAQVRVFDLRKQRQSRPLSNISTPVATHASATGVGFLKFIPNFSSPRNANAEPTGLLLCTDDGIVQFSNFLLGTDVPDNPHVYYAPLSGTLNNDDFVTAAAVSSSGQWAAVGTNAGTVGQYFRRKSVYSDAVETLSSMQIYPVNECSPNPKVCPPVPPQAPPRTVSVDDPILGTAYVLCGDKTSVPIPYGAPFALHTIARNSLLSSSLSSTPQVMRRKVRLVSKRRISGDLREKVSRQDFIGSVPNPGYLPNSLLSVRFTNSSSTVLNSPPYALTDPRRLEAQYQQIINVRSANDLQKVDSPEFRNSHRMSPAQQIPLRYLKPSSNLMATAKMRFKKFDYRSANTTDFVGLENKHPLCKINAVLQLFYRLSRQEFKNAVLAAQVSTFHHDPNNHLSLSCEMGFLFYMMQRTEQYLGTEAVHGIIASPTAICSKSSHGDRQAAVSNDGTPTGLTMGSIVVENVVHPANFTQVFSSYQTHPNAIAAGLFEESVKKNAQQFVQMALHFILKQLHAEWAAEDKRNSVSSDQPSAVEAVFGIQSKTSTTFLHSNTQIDDPVLVPSFGIELGYPGVGGTAVAPHPSKRVLQSQNNSALKGKLGALQLSTITHGEDYMHMRGLKDRRKMSFAVALWNGFRKEQGMRGWCKESETYEPFKKVQAPVSLPKSLLTLCGNTHADLKYSSIGVNSATCGSFLDDHNVGSALDNFFLSALRAVSLADGGTEGQLRSLLDTSFIWTPFELEIMREVCDRVDSLGRFIVSVRCVANSQEEIKLEGARVAEGTTLWVIYDGNEEIASPVSASLLPKHFNDKTTVIGYEALCSAVSDGSQWSIARYSLNAVISEVTQQQQSVWSPSTGNSDTAISNSDSPKKLSTAPDGHIIAHILVQGKWMLFNDFLVQPVEDLKEVLSFSSWKHPCVLCFEQNSCEVNNIAAINRPQDLMSGFPENHPIPENVLRLESISSIPSISLINSGTTLPRPEDMIAFDGEFVSVALEESTINSDGQRVISQEGRQVLARISLLSFQSSVHANHICTSGAKEANAAAISILADDYILPVEPVLDYVTRFSGIVAEDLDPVQSKHAVVTQRTAYLKLRYFIDRKYIFVGHGLQKDFETANIFIPPEQVRDTVDLWRLPNQRKISLRFLASYVLRAKIQDEVHDSIEDAKTALLLYRAYEEMSAGEGGTERLMAFLHEMYRYGNSTNWTIGTEKLSTTER